MRIVTIKPNGATREFRNFRSFNIYFTNIVDVKGLKVEMNYENTTINWEFE